MFQIDEKMDRQLYVIGWLLIAGGLAMGAAAGVLGFHPLKLLGPCMIHLLTGYYCPGCGGTRAVNALLAGRLLTSFWYHPFVLYTAAVGGWFMLSQTIERISKGRVRIAMHFRDIYMWIALGIIAVNFLIKNLALIIWKVDLLP